MALLVSALLMRGAHQIHNLLGTTEGRRKNVDQLTRVSPRNGVLERLGMDIRIHLGGDLISKGNVVLLEDGMHPPNADAMGTFQVAHCWILSRANHPDHGLIVVIDNVGVSTPQLLPKGNGRQPKTSHIAKSAATISASGVE